jgi:Flp pilus assembly protein TadG
LAFFSRISATTLAVLSAARRIRHDRAGNVAMIFALTTIPLLGAVGGAIDYSTAVRARSKLQAVADAAALFAVSRSEVGSSASTAKTDATTYFNAQAAKLGLSTSSVTITVNDTTSAGRTAVVSFNASTPTTFMKVMGFNTLAFSSTSTAAVGLPVYIDFYLLLDNTPSMGVAATPADVAAMVNNTTDQCAFACHDMSDPNNYYKLAKTLGVTTRIDVVRQATQSLMDTASSTTAVSNQYRMAIYTPGSGCDSIGLTTIAALTSNLSSAKAKPTVST